jgi:hypothetical protein
MMMKSAVPALAIVVAVAWSCSGGGPSGPAGGPVSGALDTHCTLPDGGMLVQPTSQADCKVSGTGATDLGNTMFNSEGDDDDCKYHVKFTVSPVYENSDVNFTVTATKKTDGTPAVGANVDPEVFLDTTHPAPNSNTHTTESPPGTYHVGPIHFDKAGKWTMRFHFFEQCDDSIPTSPHGHAAFFIDVP